MEAAAFEHGAFVFRILPSHFREHRRKNGACEPTGDRDGYDDAEGGMHGTMAHGREGEEYSNHEFTSLPDTHTQGQSWTHGYGVARVSTVAHVSVA